MSITRDKGDAHIAERPLRRRRDIGAWDFSDGRRNLDEVIKEVIAHQAAHLATVKRALA